MNSKIIKEVINFILVIVYTFIHVFYLAPIIYKIINTRFIAIGLWSIIIGFWGNIAGVRLIKPLFISKDYRKDNYFFIILGLLLIIIGFCVSFL